MNSDEIQYALDRRGFVRIDAGSTIEKPIQLAHLTGRVFIDCPGDITYNGPPGRWGFEWNWDSSYVHTPCHLIFRNIEFDRNSITHGGFLKFAPGTTAMPLSLTMKQCRIESEDAYAVDANGVAYINSIHCEDIRSFSSSAIRWIGTSLKATGWVKIYNWRGLVTSKVGATFLFKNGKNVVRWRLIDEGSPDLISDLRSSYYGPTSCYDINCAGFNEVDDCWSEPWGSWATVAPGCWSYEVRADETSGNYGMYYTLLKNLSINAGGMDPGVEPLKVTGGDDSTNASSLRVDIVDNFLLLEESVLFRGKVYPVSDRAMRNGPYDSNDIDHFDDLNSGSFRDYWQSGSAVLPYQVFADIILYSGSDNESNYTTEPAQYDA